MFIDLKNLGNTPRTIYNITGQYAVEIDDLRKEHESALEALQGAQNLAQQRVVERDS